MIKVATNLYEGAISSPSYRLQRVISSLVIMSGNDGLFLTAHFLSTASKVQLAKCNLLSIAFKVQLVTSQTILRSAKCVTLGPVVISWIA